MSKLKFKECEDCEEWNGNRFHCADICMKPFEAMDEFDEYKTLEEQGLLIRLPCKVGDTIFVIAENYAKCGSHYNCEDYDFEQYLITWCEKYCPNGYQGTGVIQGTVSTIKITYDAIIVQIIVESGSLWKKIKDIFLTKEAAEAALKEINKNKGE